MDDLLKKERGALNLDSKLLFHSKAVSQSYLLAAVVAGIVAGVILSVVIISLTSKSSPNRSFMDL